MSWTHEVPDSERSRPEWPGRKRGTRTQRERMVSRSWSGARVRRRMSVPSGGSSRVLRKALAASAIMRSASETTQSFMLPLEVSWRRRSASRIWSTLMRRSLDSGSMTMAPCWRRLSRSERLGQSLTSAAMETARWRRSSGWEPEMRKAWASLPWCHAREMRERAWSGAKAMGG